MSRTKETHGLCEGRFPGRVQGFGFHHLRCDTKVIKLNREISLEAIWAVV